MSGNSMPRGYNFFTHGTSDPELIHPLDKPVGVSDPDSHK